MQPCFIKYGDGISLVIREKVSLQVEMKGLPVSLFQFCGQILDAVSLL